MSAPAVPRVASNPEVKPYMPQDLVFDPPPASGVRVGDPVLCWQGHDEPKEVGKVAPGVVTLVGHNSRVSISMFPKDWSAVVPRDSCIPHDDPDSPGKLPGTWRYKPAPAAEAVLILTGRLDALVVQVDKQAKEFSDKIAEAQKKIDALVKSASK